MAFVLNACMHSCLTHTCCHTYVALVALCNSENFAIQWLHHIYIYNQVAHLSQDTNGKSANSQLDITNESQEVSPFPEGDHKALINRRAQKHNERKTEITCE